MRRGKELALSHRSRFSHALTPVEAGFATNLTGYYQRFETRVELNCWLDKEDTMWKQRSRLNWFKEGDRNTRFFHANASSRFQKNLIEGIYDDEGLWQEDEKIVVKIFVDYYSELFTTCRPSKFIEIVDAVHPKVMEAMNSTLIREFLPGEVHWALKQMYTLKALGLDGMPPLWDARTRLPGQRTRV
ncbi:hypothetical protein RGQ29_005753 [Quercus rubra]|uniref:Uncharacterized protein n=1 Tax=Quercus rubra TaxID=3512 RepID=A0AAN7IBA3_QUERU|nr:hypothetical protein RGQ29_005753 [Quercus rubra]